MILFDTDTCVEILRGNKRVINHLKSVQDEIAVSFITVAELYYGAEKSNDPEKNIINVEKFLLAFIIIESSIRIGKRFGKIKSELIKTGYIISDADIFIASTCLEYCDRLITGNFKHYERISDFKIENWMI